MVVVQASVYGTQNEVTLDAVRQFGLHRARAVAVIDDSFDDAALRRMHERGVRGVRFNMVSGNGTPEALLDALARRLAPLGWHIQIYAEGDKLTEIAPRLGAAPDRGGDRPFERREGSARHRASAVPGAAAPTGRRSRLDQAVQLSRIYAGTPWSDVAPNVKAMVAAAPEPLRVGDRLAAARRGSGAGGWACCSISSSNGYPTQRRAGASWWTTRRSCTASDGSERQLMAGAARPPSDRRSASRPSRPHTWPAFAATSQIVSVA